MGGSHTLDCRLNQPKDRAAYFRQIWPDTLLSACRAAHVRNSDLSRYTTADAIDDLDRLRAALGFPKLVLDGDSYGTYFALEFMRLHPDHVESAILDGVAPPHFMVLPLEDAAGAQLGMESLADACRRDLACQARFPGFAGQFEELVKRFDHGSVDVPVTDEKTGREEWVALSKEVFAERLRQTLYDPGIAAYIPFVVERAHEGDYGPLATMIDLESRVLGRVIEAGANLSYACAEQVPFIPEEQVAASSAGSFLGDARVRAEQRACALWNVRTAPVEAYAPVRSDLPVLMVSGTDDPTTPARYAEAQLALLPHARRVLVKGASHVTEIPCTIQAKVDFVRAVSAEGLDLAACSSAFERPPFAMSMDGFAALMSSM
jgi:pimeloyl-ACP methyl ester carboxylesterase